MPGPTGHILLAGGAEFKGRMADADLHAIELAGGFESPLVIIPAAAAPDNNHQRAGANGVRWFKSLGARRVSVLPVIDYESANSLAHAMILREAKFIYMLGGFPRHLMVTLQGSLAWGAIYAAYKNGAVIGGSSAGAMVLCQKFYDPYAGKLHAGLNLISNVCVLPHYSNFGKRWVQRLGGLLPDHLLLGIDESTGIIDDGESGSWNLYGAGIVTLHHNGEEKRFFPGEAVRF